MFLVERTKVGVRADNVVQVSKGFPFVYDASNYPVFNAGFVFNDVGSVFLKKVNFIHSRVLQILVAQAFHHPRTHSYLQGFA